MVLCLLYNNMATIHMAVNSDCIYMFVQWVTIAKCILYESLVRLANLYETFDRGCLKTKENSSPCHFPQL